MGPWGYSGSMGIHESIWGYMGIHGSMGIQWVHGDTVGTGDNLSSLPLTKDNRWRFGGCVCCVLSGRFFSDSVILSPNCSVMGLKNKLSG